MTQNHYRCPHCKAVVDCSGMLGRNVSCPNCRLPFVVPGSAAPIPSSRNETSSAPACDTAGEFKLDTEQLHSRHAAGGKRRTGRRQQQPAGPEPDVLSLPSDRSTGWIQVPANAEEPTVPLCVPPGTVLIAKRCSSGFVFDPRHPNSVRLLNEWLLPGEYAAKIFGVQLATGHLEELKHTLPELNASYESVDSKPIIDESKSLWEQPSAVFAGVAALFGGCLGKLVGLVLLGTLVLPLAMLFGDAFEMEPEAAIPVAFLSLCALLAPVYIAVRIVHGAKHGNSYVVVLTNGRGLILRTFVWGLHKKWPVRSAVALDLRAAIESERPAWRLAVVLCGHLLDRDARQLLRQTASSPNSVKSALAHDILKTHR